MARPGKIGDRLSAGVALLAAGYILWPVASGVVGSKWWAEGGGWDILFYPATLLLALRGFVESLTLVGIAAVWVVGILWSVYRTVQTISVDISRHAALAEAMVFNLEQISQTLEDIESGLHLVLHRSQETGELLSDD